ncbi:hypothetical protein KAT60_00045 [Candidatus Woesebacteria bacterium]|nr:hypothetical protein [Candidatus Woesebacteria bacterium]
MEVRDKDGEITVVAEGERPRFLERYIGGAIKLVKEKNYRQAISHLRNANVAKAVGLQFDNEARSFFIKKTPDEEKIKDLSHTIAYGSVFMHGPNKTGKIKIVDLYTLGPEITGKPRPKVPPQMWQEVALIHLEEWLHALQHIKGSSLTGHKDVEVDVADYLKLKSVPLTRNFVVRRKGREIGPS